MLQYPVIFHFHNVFITHFMYPPMQHQITTVEYCRIFLTLYPDFISQPWRKVGCEIKSGREASDSTATLQDFTCLTLRHSATS